MSAPPASRPPSGVALFDLDGTLLAWDCQLLFRHFTVRRHPWRVLFLPLFLAAAPFHRLLGDESLKRVFFGFLAGFTAVELAGLARGFARSVRPFIYPELLECLEEHRRRGHLLILASASPEFYVREIGAMLGFDLSLGTSLAHGERCPLLPRMENHKGAAKVRRLAKELPENHFHNGMLVNSHGYTDSSADLPMLAICSTATVVNPSPELARLAAGNGWEIVRPARPWRGFTGKALRSLALLCGLGKNAGGRVEKLKAKS